MKKLAAHFRQYRFLLGELVKKGIKLKYRRSYLGIFWTMLEPLLNMIVLAVIFGPLFGYSSDKTFPVYILSGRLIYSLFAQGTKEATRSIRANAAMIKKVYVPQYLYPLSYVLYNYVIFLISLVVLVVVSLILGVFPGWNVLFVLVPLINSFLLTLGVSMILATVGVFFRDMEYLWNVLTTLIFYCCAIFYKIDRYADSKVVWILKLNPLYSCIDNFRSCVFNTEFNWNYALYSFCFSLVALAFGVLIFRKNQHKFILHI
ncbi:MAG: ABC transporter permease [Clostridia bacterium]|nr:ABC transporter permease [Clostridia bacterium]